MRTTGRERAEFPAGCDDGRRDPLGVEPGLQEHVGARDPPLVRRCPLGALGNAPASRHQRARRARRSRSYSSRSTPPASRRFRRSRARGPRTSAAGPPRHGPRARCCRTASSARRRGAGRRSRCRRLRPAGAPRRARATAAGPRRRRPAGGRSRRRRRGGRRPAAAAARGGAARRRERRCESAPLHSRPAQCGRRSGEARSAASDRGTKSSELNGSRPLDAHGTPTMPYAAMRATARPGSSRPRATAAPAASHCRRRFDARCRFACGRQVRRSAPQFDARRPVRRLAGGRLDGSAERHLTEPRFDPVRRHAALRRRRRGRRPHRRRHERLPEPSSDAGGTRAGARGRVPRGRRRAGAAAARRFARSGRCIRRSSAPAPRCAAGPATRRRQAAARPSRSSRSSRCGPTRRSRRAVATRPRRLENALGQFFVGDRTFGA